MKISYYLCRLCKSTKTEEALDLFKSSSLIMKISYCTGLQISSEDNLPNYICKRCNKKINKFYNFKLKCLNVEEEFKNIGIMKYETFEEEGQSPKSRLSWTLKDSLNVNYNQDSMVNEKETISTVCTNNKLRTQNDLQSIQCEQCGEVFITKISFKKHVYLNHAQSKMFRCKHCPKMFTTAENCYTHIRSHSGIKPYVCEICGKASTKRSDLVRHKKIHSNEKNHKCQICDRRFKRSSDLCVHIRTHSGVRPYKCRICEKDYTSHSGLRKHLNSHNKHHLAVT